MNDNDLELDAAERSYQEDLAAELAGQLLGDPLLNEALELLERDALSDLRAVDLADQDAQRVAVMQLQAVHVFRGALQSKVNAIAYRNAGVAIAA